MCTAEQYKPSLPIGETDASIEEIRTTLVNIFEQEGPTMREATTKMMSKSYYGQRKDINNGIVISLLKEKWPFLFLDINLLQHFYMLTEVPGQNLEEKLRRKLVYIFKHFQNSDESNNATIQKLMKNNPDAEKDVNKLTSLVILMLLAQMKEKHEHMLLLYDVSQCIIIIIIFIHFMDHMCIIILSCVKYITKYILVFTYKYIKHR